MRSQRADLRSLAHRDDKYRRRYFPPDTPSSAACFEAYVRAPRGGRAAEGMRAADRTVEPSPTTPYEVVLETATRRESEPPTPKHVASSQARRLKLAFGMEIEQCVRCGGGRRSTQSSRSRSSLSADPLSLRICI